jgi:hypothetical protein
MNTTLSGRLPNTLAANANTGPTFRPQPGCARIRPYRWRKTRTRICTRPGGNAHRIPIAGGQQDPSTDFSVFQSTRILRRRAAAPPSEDAVTPGSAKRSATQTKRLGDILHLRPIRNEVNVQPLPDLIGAIRGRAEFSAQRFQFGF